MLVSASPRRVWVCVGLAGLRTSSRGGHRSACRSLELGCVCVCWSGGAGVRSRGDTDQCFTCVCGSGGARPRSRKSKSRSRKTNIRLYKSKSRSRKTNTRSRKSKSRSRKIKSRSRKTSFSPVHVFYIFVVFFLLTFLCLHVFLRRRCTFPILFFSSEVKKPCDVPVVAFHAVRHTQRLCWRVSLAPRHATLPHSPRAGDRATDCLLV